MNILDTKFYDGNMALKLDIVKDFVTMEWDILWSMLRAFGSSKTFFSWKETILEFMTLSILFNGSPHGYFRCGRGVRQGDPLSMLLF